MVWPYCTFSLSNIFLYCNIQPFHGRICLCRDYHGNLCIVMISNAIQSICDYLYNVVNAGELDLVFLDIEMEGTNGMDTARALREADQSLQLVFVTGYSDYVFDGYEVGALGYLLKPAGAEELERVLTRALTALQRQEEELFFCRSGEVFYRIRRDAILYFRSVTSRYRHHL